MSDAAPQNATPVNINPDEMPHVILAQFEAHHDQHIALTVLQARLKVYEEANKALRKINSQHATTIVELRSRLEELEADVSPTQDEGPLQSNMRPRFGANQAPMPDPQDDLADDEGVTYDPSTIKPSRENDKGIIEVDMSKTLGQQLKDLDPKVKDAFKRMHDADNDRWDSLAQKQTEAQTRLAQAENADTPEFLKTFDAAQMADKIHSDPATPTTETSEFLLSNQSILK